MGKNCEKCTQQFEIAKEDAEFYKQVKVPEPTFCPKCRQQRRLAFRNERHLFKRKCNLCSKDIVTAFKEDSPYKVYCNDCWWGDSWDPFSYGEDFDFSKPFFPQLNELIQKVPKMALLQLSNENSEYSNYTGYSKNTYMSAGSYLMEDCYYARKSRYCKDCLNSNFLDKCELVNASINCFNCYNCNSLVNSRNCTDCSYMADSSGCENCFMCSGIFNKKYHYKNEKYSKEEYQKIVDDKRKQSPEELMKEFQEFNKTIPKKYQNLLNCENSSGDYLQNCKNATECYDSFEIEDSKYVIESFDLKNSMDVSMQDKQNELSYEVSAGGESNYNLKFSFCSCATTDSYYLYSCMYLTESFGCDGFHSKQKNCILNKKYSKEDYEKLKEKIIEHMKETKEWGEFMPITLSPYPYNHTIAQDYHPITQKEAKERGYKWEEKDETNYKPATATLPDNIGEATDSITKEIFACEDCGKNYKVIKQELDLSKKMGQPLSKKCPDCRQLELLKVKNPRKLWSRQCAKCSTNIQTTYAPDSPATAAAATKVGSLTGFRYGGKTVYCEKCYLGTVY